MFVAKSNTIESVEIKEDPASEASWEIWLAIVTTPGPGRYQYFKVYNQRPDESTVRDSWHYNRNSFSPYWDTV